jgi:hypothetical protein
MPATKKLVFCLLSVLVLSVYGHTLDEDPQCAHGKFVEEPMLLDVDENFIVDDGRNLLTTTYPGLRMTADYTRLTDGTQEFKDYVSMDLLPPVLDYFQAALDIKQPLTSALKISSTTICGYTTPTALTKGVSTDFFVVVTSTEDDANWVASAGACYLSSTTKRPLIARMMFNMIYTKATDDVLVHEKNMYLTMHEMLHALGFAGSSFKNFIDASGNTLTGHIKTVLLNGSNRTVLDVAPLTSKLRTHFGCATLPGAFMEDDGGAGTEGSHFERRHFLYETMTSGVIHGRRITEFSLSVLEGSGWYMPNYTYAEPFYFGQGQGCNFLYADCAASNFASYGFSDFCTGSTRGCTQVGRGGGICSNDTRSEECRYNIPNYDYDCENEFASDNARFPTKEVFGRGAGARCFEGNVSTLSKSSLTSFCLKFTCVGSGTSTTLEVMFGTTKITCTKESQVKVTGYYGLLNCPDPLTYCSTVGKKYCPRNCLGRGNCVSGVCQCKTGFTGIDCALRVV